jgi:hypothetical protein
MKFLEPRSLAGPDIAARKIVEIVSESGTYLRFI